MAGRKFEQVKMRLKSEWGYSLYRGSKDLGHGFSTGYIVIGKLYQVHFNTLKEIETALDKKQ